MIPRRRALLLSGLSVAVAELSGPCFAQTSLLPGEFLALSSRLTGVPVTALGIDTAGFILKCLQERHPTSALSALYAQPHADSELSREVVAAWYSGLCQTTTGTVVATHDRALVWHSTSFMHPPGICGEAFGHWSDPPAT